MRSLRITLLFLALGVVLSASGMSDALAHAGARSGSAYPAIAPWIGALVHKRMTKANPEQPKARIGPLAT